MTKSTAAPAITVMADNVFEFLDRNVSEYVLGPDSVKPEFSHDKLVEYTAVASPFRHWPRFGHTDQVAAVFRSIGSNSALQEETSVASAQQPADWQDYGMGLVAMAIVIVVLVVLWSLIVLLLSALASRCCCCEWNRIGFLSGQAFTYRVGSKSSTCTSRRSKTSNSETSSSSEQDYDDHQEHASQRLDQWERRTRRIRLTVVFAGCALLLASFFGLKKGYAKVESTWQVVETSLNDVRQWMDDASAISEHLKDVGKQGRDLRHQLTAELAKDKLCPNDLDGWQQDEVARDIDANAQLAVEMMNYMGDFIHNSLQRFESGLEHAHSYANQVENALVTTQQYEPWVGPAVFVPSMVLAAILVIATMIAQAHAMTTCGSYLTTWLLVPLLFIWTLVCVVVSVSMAVGATTNADVCSGTAPNMTQPSPDATLMNLVSELPVNQTGLAVQVAHYYIYQCTESAEVDPFLFLRYYDAELNHAGGVVRELVASIANINIEDWSARCGRDFLPLRTSLDTMTQILDGLHQLSSESLELLSCARVVPVTTHLLYDGACTESMTGLTWMASCLLVMVIMAMIMITFRAAFYNNVVLLPCESDAFNTDDSSTDSVLNGMSERTPPQPEDSRNSFMLPTIDSLAESEIYIRDDDNVVVTAIDDVYLQQNWNQDPPLNPSSTIVVPTAPLELECCYSEDNQYLQYPTFSASMEGSTTWYNHSEDSQRQQYSTSRAPTEERTKWYNYK